MRTLHALVLATTPVGLCAEEEEKWRLSPRRCPAMVLRMMRCREDAIVDQLHLSLTPERFAVCNHVAGVHSGCPQHDTIQGLQRVCFVCTISMLARNSGPVRARVIQRSISSQERLEQLNRVESPGPYMLIRSMAYARQ